MTARNSDPQDEDFSQVYPHLRRMAARYMADQSSDHTLQATALVHEAWLRLSPHRARTWWKSNARFCAVAATTMRRILIDRSRFRATVQRGGRWKRVPEEEGNLLAISADEKMILVHDALTALEKEDAVHARVVALKFFVGLSNREVAEEMAVTERTVERYWAHAKVWLYNEILLGR